jgi:hypothetical protein
VFQQAAINDKNQNITQKLVYGSPILVCYGKVGELTQSGSAGSTENAPHPGTAYQKPTASDPRAKENIVRIGTHPFGIGLYLFDYKPEFQAQWGYGRQFGVMADEVETVMPEAVCVHANGYKMVDYAMLGVEHSIH